MYHISLECYETMHAYVISWQSRPNSCINILTYL